MSAILYYLEISIELLVETKCIYTITALFTLMIFVMSFQDIAVDAWAVEILLPENSSYAGACQSVGQLVG
jgi:hypothetical protein